jgi:nucleoid-associated protein YgaU
MNLLTGLSAVLFIICFVMGAGLIQNQDRISVMEDQLVQLSTAYRNLFVQLSDATYSPVFAEDEPNREANSGPPDVHYDYEDEPAPPGHEPEPTPEPTPEPIADISTVSLIPDTYTIQPGDSLIAISIRFYGDDTAVNEILAINGIDNADFIQAGKTIALPKR